MGNPDLDLDLVRCFLTVAESGGFTPAARRLGLSQSAVSLKIQRLETVLGGEVFIRTSRSLALTPAGEAVLGYARRLLDLSQEMVRLAARPPAEGSLRIGIAQQFSPEFLAGLLSRFRRRRPGVSLTVEIGMTLNLLRDLEEDRFDLVVGAAGQTPSPGSRADAFIEDRVLMKEPLFWVRSASSLPDLREDPVPLVLFAPPCGTRRVTLDLLEKARRPWQIVYSSTSLSSIQAAVRAGLGISVLGNSSLLPGMEVIPPSEGFPALAGTAIAVYRRKSAFEPLAGSFAAFIEREIAQQQERLSVKTF